MPTSREVYLEQGAKQWEGQAALYEQNQPFLADCCKRAAKALRIQAETGIPVCACCFKPFQRGGTQWK